MHGKSYHHHSHAELRLNKFFQDPFPRGEGGWDQGKGRLDRPTAACRAMLSLLHLARWDSVHLLAERISAQRSEQSPFFEVGHGQLLRSSV